MINKPPVVEIDEQQQAKTNSQLLAELNKTTAETYKLLHRCELHLINCRDYLLYLLIAVGLLLGAAFLAFLLAPGLVAG